MKPHPADQQTPAKSRTSICLFEVMDWIAEIEKAEAMGGKVNMAHQVLDIIQDF